MPTHEIADFGGEQVLVIKINRSLAAGRSVYDATRAAWKLTPDRAARASWIVAASRGEILDVFEADRWLPAFHEELAHLSDPENDHDRYGFVGDRAPRAVRERWVGRRLPSDLMRKGASNPVRYVNIDP